MLNDWYNSTDPKYKAQSNVIWILFIIVSHNHRYSDVLIIIIVTSSWNLDRKRKVNGSTLLYYTTLYKTSPENYTVYI